MDDVFDRIDPVQAWAVTATGLIVTLVVGSVAFPRRVYDGFVWRYFWGPVVADGTGSACAQRVDGETVLLDGASECRRAAGIVAESGYTTVSTVSYALVLVFALIGVVFLLRRLGIGEERGFLFALFPFLLFGGALRTVEDASIALLRAGDPAISFPWSGVLISPLIYFTVFFITLAALLVSVAAARRGIVRRYEPLLAGMGTVALVTTLGYLGWLAATTDLLTVHPLVPVITLGGATLITAVVWIATERLAPAINDGTGYMGVLVIWGHTVDGIANVLSLDWGTALGLPTYTSKHVVNRTIVDVTSSLQPASVSDAIGTAWPFLLVKVGAALFIVWVFNEEIFEDSPRYAMLLLVAIVAVGLGPGTRDFLRATFGI